MTERQKLYDQLDTLIRKITRKRDLIGVNQFRCISCGKLLPIDLSENGHYVPRSCSILRFSLSNCHRECRLCNCFDPDHLIGYRKNLIERIGLKQVEELEQMRFQTVKYSISDLKDMVSELKRKFKEYE